LGHHCPTPSAGARAPLVIVNGKVLNPDGTLSEAVAVAGNQIVRVGTSSEMAALKIGYTSGGRARSGRAGLHRFLSSIS
jgi:hypothetical protein